MKGWMKVALAGITFFIIYLFITLIATPAMGLQNGSLAKSLIDALLTLVLFLSATAVGRWTK